MRRGVLSATVLLTAAIRALAGHGEDSTIWVTDVSADIDSGWTVSGVAGPSDYFSVAHDVDTGNGNSEQVVEGMPVTGVAVSIADFGSFATFPLVGVFNSNLSLDASGATPDLGSPVTSAVNPPRTVVPFFGYADFDLSEGTIPAGSTKAHSVIQFPPGDTGLAVGADSSGSAAGTSGFSFDGYATPAFPFGFLDLGINVGQDNTTTTSCKAVDRKPHGRLRVAKGLDPGAGDHLTVTVDSGDAIDLSFFGNAPGDMLQLYLMNPATCTPIGSFGPILGTIADDDDGPDDGSYLRVSATWPACNGGLTVSFAAIWGNAACTPNGAGVGFTNCVTIISVPNPEPPYPTVDDGTIESGWIAQFPAGPADYFNNNLGAPPTGLCNVIGLSIAVMDFGTSASGFPTAGVSNANLTVDPSGNTPDIAGALAVVAPFTFVPGSVASTSGTYTTQAVLIPGTALGVDVHGWVQFPPGDPGLLGVGADTSSASAAASFFAIDGYAAAALPFFPNWGIRLQSN